LVPRKIWRRGDAHSSRRFLHLSLSFSSAFL